MENALKTSLQREAIDGATTNCNGRQNRGIRAFANMKNDSKGGFDESYNYTVERQSEPRSV